MTKYRDEWGEKGGNCDALNWHKERSLQGARWYRFRKLACCKRKNSLLISFFHWNKNKGHQLRVRKGEKKRRRRTSERIGNNYSGNAESPLEVWGHKYKAIPISIVKKCFSLTSYNGLGLEAGWARSWCETELVASQMNLTNGKRY